MAGVDYLSEAEGALVICETHLHNAVKLLAYIAKMHRVDLGTAAADAGLAYNQVSYILHLADKERDNQ